jgi:hypothetical protein
MEFRRIEVTRVLRHREVVEEEEEIKRVFEALLKYNLNFSICIHGTGTMWRQCVVLSPGEDEVEIYARKPQKIKHRVAYIDVISLEVEANCDIVSEADDGGRWAQLI